MRQQQAGFSLMATVFILIVLSLAGVYLLRMGIADQQIVNYELLTARARLANLSAFDLFAQDLSPNQRSCQDKTYHFNREEKALSGMDVNITCLQTISYPLDNPHYIAWQLKVVARYGQLGQRDYVSQEQTRWKIILSNAQ